MTLTTLKIDDIRFKPYWIEKCVENREHYIIVFCHERGRGICLKNYNGVCIPAQNLIMFLGNEENLDVEEWSEVITHEILHFILFDFGITSFEISECLVRLLERMNGWRRAIK